MLPLDSVVYNSPMAKKPSVRKNAPYLALVLMPITNAANNPTNAGFVCLAPELATAMLVPVSPAKTTNSATLRPSNVFPLVWNSVNLVRSICNVVAPRIFASFLPDNPLVSVAWIAAVVRFVLLVMFAKTSETTNNAYLRLVLALPTNPDTVNGL